MADVTDPEAIRFINEQVRPVAERLRNLQAVCEDLAAQWALGIDATVGSSADDDILDDRDAEGVSRLTAADVTNLVAQISAFLAQCDGAGVMDVIRKPCVRAMIVSES